MDDETFPQRIKRGFDKLFGAFSPVVLVVLGLAVLFVLYRFTEDWRALGLVGVLFAGTIRHTSVTKHTSVTRATRRVGLGPDVLAGMWAKAGTRPNGKNESDLVFRYQQPTAYEIAPGSAEPGEPVAEPVDVSAFAPAAVERGGEALLQVYLHRPDESAHAEKQAKDADAETRPRGVDTLREDVAIGQRLRIAVDAPGASIDAPSQALIWRGVARACQFLLSVAGDAPPSPLSVRVTVWKDDAPVGRLLFRLPVVDRATPATSAIEITGASARRYSRAFLSYASPDRVEVLKSAQTLKAARVSFFQDLLSLDPGERYERRLYTEIDRCDLFLLFWSSHALASQWVAAETDYALARHAGDDDAPPDIVPIVLEGPPVPLPPAKWKAINFNDYVRSVIAGEEAAPARRPIA